MEKYQNYVRLLSDPGTEIANPTITVYNTGTLVLASIYADNAASPTPKSNPFTGDSAGFFSFYAPNGRYDVKMSGGTPTLTTVTLGDVSIGGGGDNAPTYTYATLPTSGSAANAGRLARVSDKSQGLWMDTGVQWASLNVQWFDAGEFNFVGDGITDNSDMMDTLLTAVEALDGSLYRGSIIQIPFGVYYFSRGITLKRGVMLRGSGMENSALAVTATRANTCLLFAAGVDGVTTSTTFHGLYSQVADLEIRAVSKSSTKHGIVMPAVARVRNVHVVGFKGHGINITASSASSQDANGWWVEQSRIDSCDGDGLHVSGTDANGGNAIGVTAANNGGWGFFNNATYGSTYIGCTDDANTTGGVKSSNRSVYIGHLNKTGQPANELDEPGTIIGGTWLSGFASGMESARLSDDKINLGAAMNPAWTTAGETSALSRGFYCDLGASITAQVDARAATGRVAHGITDIAPTATWTLTKMATTSNGGAQFYGLSAEPLSLALTAYGVGEITATGVSDYGQMQLDAAKKSGNGTVAIGSTAHAIAFTNAGVSKSYINGDGSLYVRGTNGMTFGGDVCRVGTTTITNMAIGYRADVLTSTNEFLSFQGTGRINQGATSLASANTLGLWQIATTSGGIQQLYFTAAAIAFDLRGIATTEVTTSTSATTAALMLDARKVSGTSTTTFGNTANLLAIANNGTVRTVVKGNGDLLMVAGDVTLADPGNLILGTSTGTKIGTATSQKLGLWNATPIVQPTTAVSAATFVVGSGTAVNDASTFDGYTLKQIVKALRNIGALA